MAWSAVWIVLAVGMIVYAGVAAMLSPVALQHGRPPVAHRSAATHGLAALPAAARGVVAQRLGAVDRGSWAHRSGTRATFSDPRTGIDAQVSRRGVVVRVGAVSWSLGLRAVGRGGQLEPTRAASPVVRANQVTLQHAAAVEESYDYGPFGLEQSFTIGKRSAGPVGAPVVLAVGKLPRGLTPVVAPDGRSLSLERGGRDVLRYWGLFASDARGQVLPARIVLSSRALWLRIDDRGARYPVRVDPFIQAGKLTASDAATNDNLGLSVAVSRDTIVVGAPAATVSGNHFEGAAYVFVKPANGWASAKQTAKLTPSDGANDWEFGSGVAISGDTIAVGAPELSGGIANGAVYVFVKPAAGWTDATETAKLTASDGHDQDGLGAPLAMSADTIAAGNFRGAVYVFTRPAGGWANSVQTAKLTTSDNTAAESVAIDADTITAGANNANIAGHVSQGAVYVYTKPNTGWADGTETAKLTASDGTANDNLGISVGVSGDVIAAGARYAAAPATKQGAVYVFVKAAGGWANGTQTAKLTASDGAANDTLGSSVSISGDTIVAGAPQPSPSTGNGAMYVFTRPAGSWQNATQSDKLIASDGASGDQFGSAVAITPDVVVAGAPHVTVGGNQSEGAAYVYATAGGTSTSVSCFPASVTAGTATACTATVSNAVAGGSDPTGSVTFSTDSSGSFESGGVCMLSSTQTAGVESCSVHYIPSSVGTGTHTITAGYGGDGSHASSSGSAQVTVTSTAGGGGNGGGGSGGGTGGGGTGSGGNGVVVARFGLVGPAQTLAHSLLLNGGSSSTTTGGIADYTWIVGAPGQPPVVDPCGPAPLVAMNFQQAGIHDVTLKVTTTLGQTSQTTQRLNVPAVATNQWFDASYDCENPGSGNVPNRGDCVKTFGWGVVQVNSRGNADDCFQLQQRDALRQPNPASDRATAALVSPNIAHLWATHATINGPIAIDGLYLPVPESVHSDFDDWKSTIQIGRPIPIAVGPYHLATIGLNAVVGDPLPHTDKVPLIAAIGLTDSNAQLGALPLGGLVDVNLSTDRTPDGFNESMVKLHVKLPSPLPQVDAYLASDNENGAHLTGFQVGPIDLPLSFGLTLNHALFTYMGGDHNVWSGSANIFLPFAMTGLPQPGVPGVGPGIQFSPPPPDLGIGFRDGNLDHLGIGVIFPAAAEPPLFLGVGLRDVHFAVAVQPQFRFTGGLGVDVGQVIGIDGDAFVAFASHNNPYLFPASPVPGGNGDLQPLVGRYLDSFTFAIGADAHFLLPFLDKITLLNAWVIYEAPDYFEIGSSFDFDDFLELKGNGGGWIEPSQGKFNIGGSLSLCLNHVKILGVSIHPCISDGVVVSSRGVGGCATLIVPVPVLVGTVPVPVTLTAGYTSDGGFQLDPFDCNLDPFTEANPRGAGDHPAADSRAAAGAGSWSFRVPPHAPSTEARITGEGAPPDITITGPGGQTYSTANPPSDVRHVMMFEYGDTTLIALNHPESGTWRITSNPGSVQLASVAYAIGQPAPNVKAHLLGRGRTRTLTYTDVPARGRVITFVERGARTYHILGVAHGRRGRIRFHLADGRAGRREIVAQVEENGIQTQSVEVARYSAPGPQRPGRPARVRVTHRGYTLTVNWTPVPGAAEYEVLVEAADRGREITVVRAHRARIVGIEPGLRGKVLVDAVSANGLGGPKAARTFPRAPIPQPKRPKLKSPKPTRHHR